MSINGHKTSCTRVMYLKRKKRKDTYYPHYIPQINIRTNTPPNKNSPILTLPLRMTTLISPKLLPLFVMSNKG